MHCRREDKARKRAIPSQGALRRPRRGYDFGLHRRSPRLTARRPATLDLNAAPPRRRGHLTPYRAPRRPVTDGERVEIDCQSACKNGSGASLVGPVTQSGRRRCRPPPPNASRPCCWPAAPVLGCIVKEKFFNRLTLAQLGALDEIRKALTLVKAPCENLEAETMHPPLA